jgi:hypothetical protein
MRRADDSSEMVPSTLGEYRDLIAAIAPTSAAVAFLDERIASALAGRAEVVTAADSQMRALLFPMLMVGTTDV